VEQFIVKMRTNAILIKKYRERCEEAICIYHIDTTGQEK